MQVSWGAVKQAGYEKGNEGKWVKVEKHAGALAAARQRMAGGKNSVPLFTATIQKVSDDDQRLVFGWASIIEDEAGNLIVDSQGDTITPDELEKAAYAFVHDVRRAGEMHATSDGIGQVVESMVLTKAKREAMGLPPGASGWWIGMKISDDAVWDKVKKGEYSAFSIGGRGTRKELSE